MPLKHKIKDSLAQTFGLGSLAGLVGGAAEIVWISIAYMFGGTSPVGVARAIAGTLGHSSTSATSTALMGASIHLALAGLLGGVMYMVWIRLLKPSKSRVSIMVFSIATLVAVWAINFYLVLPNLDPGFIVKVPVVTGLISKLSFAVAFCASIWATEPRKRMRAASAIKAHLQ